MSRFDESLVQQLVQSGARERDRIALVRRAPASVLMEAACSHIDAFGDSLDPNILEAKRRLRQTREDPGAEFASGSLQHQLFEAFVAQGDKPETAARLVRDRYDHLGEESQPARTVASVYGRAAAERGAAELAERMFPGTQPSNAPTPSGSGRVTADDVRRMVTESIDRAMRGAPLREPAR